MSAAEGTSDEVMASADLMRRLDAAGVSYDVLPHAHTERAADEARALGLLPDEVGKTLVLTVPDGHVRAVIPASERIDLRKVREILGVGKKKVHLASEEDLARDYPEFDLGAVPPFGGTSRDRVLVDRRVAERESVVLEAGSHDESIRLRTDDLVRLSGAQVVDICSEEEVRGE
jgi:Ala-tRNA(Pro) deacylase